MRAYIEIDAKKLEKNFTSIKAAVKKDIIAVVKSNAYGHGINEVVRILNRLQPKMFAVATSEEGLLIRKNLISTPILLLGREDDFRFIYSYKLTATIVSIEHLKILSKSPYPLMCHLLIDTGMMRDGIMPDQMEDALAIIKKSHLIIKGIFTHYTSAQNFKKQHETFAKCLQNITNKSLIIHSQASSTLLENCPECNAVRVGLALYGLGENSISLEPILTLKAPITRVQKVESNTFVGYLESEQTKKAGYILTVPYGYSDGLNLAHKQIGYVDNFFVPQIGRICMDHMMFFSVRKPEELTIELLGDHIKVDELASVFSTIPYELVVHLSSRLKRTII